jgi:hypothetical protein
MNTCLYCSNLADSLEHVLPAAFGEFANAPNLVDRLCSECNENLGNLDQQLARAGPEGFFRKWYGIEGRKRDKKVNPFYRGSAGARRQEFVAWDANWGVKVNIEVEDGHARQLRQLIFVERDSGKTHNLPIPEYATPEGLCQAYHNLGVVAPFHALVSVAPEEEAWVKSLLKQAWPALQFGESIRGSTVFEGATGEFQANARYLRAFAKIGFHYFLTQFGIYSGNETIFSKVRQFISDDTTSLVSVNDFIGERQCPLLGEMVDPNIRPDGWRAHLLCAEIKPGECIAHVQMFLTKDWRAPIYTIRLANDPAIAGVTAAGHSYCYYHDGQKGRFVGETTPLSVTRANYVLPPLAPAVKSASR